MLTNSGTVPKSLREVGVQHSEGAGEDTLVHACLQFAYGVRLHLSTDVMSTRYTLSVAERSNDQGTRMQLRLLDPASRQPLSGLH
jgi:hypothetical protein